MSKKIITKAEFAELSKVMDPLDIIQKYNIEEANSVESKEQVISYNKVKISESSTPAVYCKNCGSQISNGFKCKCKVADSKIIESNIFWLQILRVIYIFFLMFFLPVFIYASLNNGFVTSQGQDISAIYEFVFIMIPYLFWICRSYAIYLKYNFNDDKNNTVYKTTSGVFWKHIIGWYLFHAPFLILNELWNNKKTNISLVVKIYWILSVVLLILSYYTLKSNSKIFYELIAILWILVLTLKSFFVFSITNKQIKILKNLL
jgi:hypothetical protein